MKLKHPWTCLFSFILLAGINAPLNANQASDDDHLLGILTVPSVEGNIVYFAGWPSNIYAFDEKANKASWTNSLDPAIDNYSVELLPAAPPRIESSFLILHLDRTIYCVSRIDGRSIWSISSALPAFWYNTVRSSDPLPGYFIRPDTDMPMILILEHETDSWSVSGRRLGDGGIAWQAGLPGEPRGWWRTTGSIIIACELTGTSGDTTRGENPVAIVCFESRSGNIVYSSDVQQGTKIKSTLRSTGRIFLLEQLSDTGFQVRALNETSGDIYRTIEYESGEFIDALQSDDKLVFLHRKLQSETPMVEFRLYYSSLNPIRFQSVLESRPDQLFSSPRVDGNLFFYAGAAYSLYDGNRVWRDDFQRNTVDWLVDSHNVYVWDRSGFLQCLDRLDGSQKWRIPFNVIPPESITGENFTGASLSINGDRLIATTPVGEIYRINMADGSLHPGVPRVGNSKGLDSRKSLSLPFVSEPRDLSLNLQVLFGGILLLITIFILLYLHKTRAARMKKTDQDSDF